MNGRISAYPSPLRSDRLPDAKLRLEEFWHRVVRGEWLSFLSSAPAAETKFDRIPGDQRRIDRADRCSDHPVGFDPGLVQRFVDAGLIGAKRAALEDEHDLSDVILIARASIGCAAGVEGSLLSFMTLRHLASLALNEVGIAGDARPRGGHPRGANAPASGSGLSVGMREPVRPVISRVPRWNVT